MRQIGGSIQGLAYPNKFCEFSDRWINHTQKGVGITTISGNTTISNPSGSSSNGSYAYGSARFLFYDNLVVNAGVTLSLGTASAGGLLVICCKSLTLNGSISVSGVSTGTSNNILSIDPFGSSDLSPSAAVVFIDSPFNINSFGGYFGGSTNPLKSVLSKYTLLSPSTKLLTRGSALTGAYSAGGVIIIAESVSIAATGSILANGVDAPAISNSYSGGYGGLVGVFANSITIANGSVISAKGGAATVAGTGTNNGGAGGVIWAVARTTLLNNGLAANQTISGGAASGGSVANNAGEDGSKIITQFDWLG